MCFDDRICMTRKKAEVRLQKQKIKISPNKVPGIALENKQKWDMSQTVIKLLPEASHLPVPTKRLGMTTRRNGTMANMTQAEA